MDLNAHFGHLRSLMHETYSHVDRATPLSLDQWLARTSKHDELMALLDDVHQHHPDIYRMQWRPYLKDTLPPLGFACSTVAQLKHVMALVPSGARAYLYTHMLSSRDLRALCRPSVLSKVYYLDVSQSRLLFRSHLDRWQQLLDAQTDQRLGFRASECGLGLDHIKALVDSPSTEQLQELSIEHNQISTQSAPLLSQLALHTLNISSNDLDPQWCAQYAPDVPPRVFVSELCHLRDDGLVHLIDHVFDDHLRHLSVGTNQLTGRFVDHLIRRAFSQLHRLDIHNNWLRDGEINALLNAPLMDTVEHLNLSHCQLSTQAFVDCQPKALKTLEVSGNPLDASWVDACLNMARGCALETIVAKRIDLPMASWRRLQSMPTLKRLEFHTPESMYMMRAMNQAQQPEIWTRASGQPTST